MERRKGRKDRIYKSWTENPTVNWSFIRRGNSRLQQRSSYKQRIHLEGSISHHSGTENEIFFSHCHFVTWVECVLNPQNSVLLACHFSKTFFCVTFDGGFLNFLWVQNLHKIKLLGFFKFLKDSFEFWIDYHSCFNVQRGAV